jgi:hypothetical protein
VQRRVQGKAFENVMESLHGGEVSRVIINTATGPEQVRLVAPKGLFRLVMRSKSGNAKARLHGLGARHDVARARTVCLTVVDPEPEIHRVDP